MKLLGSHRYGCVLNTQSQQNTLYFVDFVGSHWTIDRDLIDLESSMMA